MSVLQVRRVAVVGASSQIGRALLPRLAAEGIQVFKIGRGDPAANVTETHVLDEQNRCFNPPIDSVDAIISLAPLPVIATVLDMASIMGAQRIIAFGSTGRFSKEGSSSAIEQDFVVQQAHAEQLLVSQSDAAGVAWTLFRPTMIYGADEDLNVAFIKSMVRRFGLFPIPWGAKGLRQPVHIDDLAAACMLALSCERTFNRAYNLGGGEILTFPELVRRIFHAEGKRAVLLPVPLTLYNWLIFAAGKILKANFVRKEMAARMFKDLTVINKPAIDDFGFNPRPFTPNG